MNDVASVLAGLVRLLHLTVTLGAIVVCALHLGRSRWVGLLLGGFVVEIVVSLGYWVMPMVMMRAGELSPSGLGVAYAALSAVGLLGHGAVVVGLAGLLRDWSASASAA
jgi:hypothetical protein